MYTKQLLASNPAQVQQHSLEKHLLGLVSRESAIALGNTYISTQQRITKESLLEEFNSNINKAIGNSKNIQNISPASIISKLHSSDFTHSRTVSIDGWILSQTEVNLYALAALS